MDTFYTLIDDDDPIKLFCFSGQNIIYHMRRFGNLSRTIKMSIRTRRVMSTQDVEPVCL